MTPLAFDPVEDLALPASVALPALGDLEAAERTRLPCVAGHSPIAPKIAMKQAMAISPSMISGIVILSLQ